MNTVREIKDNIKKRLSEIVKEVNLALSGGKALQEVKDTLQRLGRGGKTPHWYAMLENDGALPNLDGKSLGSVLEMVFVAVLENKFCHDAPMVPLAINPARGIDIPALQLGVKSPSENYCTSEPFFSAYERLIGNEHDAVILLTDYQTRKSRPPLQIQIIKYAYLKGSQIADKNLCEVAKAHRANLLRDNVSELKKIVRFLAHINQSDWEAKALLKLLNGDLSDNALDKKLKTQIDAFTSTNEKQKNGGKEPLPEEILNRLETIGKATPRWLSVVNAADNWVIETQKDFGRYPNDNEWERFQNGNLDGEIGMSFALQWRYNFSPLFKEKKLTTGANKRTSTKIGL